MNDFIRRDRNIDFFKSIDGSLQRSAITFRLLDEDLFPIISKASSVGGTECFLWSPLHIHKPIHPYIHPSNHPFILMSIHPLLLWITNWPHKLGLFLNICWTFAYFFNAIFSEILLWFSMLMMTSLSSLGSMSDLNSSSVNRSRNLLFSMNCRRPTTFSNSIFAQLVLALKSAFTFDVIIFESSLRYCGLFLILIMISTSRVGNCC